MNRKLLRLALCAILFYCLPAQVVAQWSLHQSPPTRTDIQSVQLIDEQKAFIGAGAGVYRTQDGGATWKRFRLQAYTADSLHIELMQNHQIHFVDDKVGFSAGWSMLNYGMVLKTVDGGINWKIVYSGPSLGDRIDYTFRDITFVNQRVGYIVGTKGTVLKTTDAGETWTDVRVPIPAAKAEDSYFNSIFFRSELDGYVAGSSLYRTQDGGRTWQEIISEENQLFTFHDIHFFGSQQGIAAVYVPQFSTLQRVPIYKTSDGGHTWLPVMQPDLAYESSGFSEIVDLHFADSQHGYAVGRSEAWKTKDGGNYWERLNFTPGGTLQKVHTFQNNKAMMVGNYGLMYKADQLNEVTRPLARFTKPKAPVYCANTSYTFENQGPQHYTYKWYVNDELVANTYHLTTELTGGKNHEIKLVSEHNGLTDFAIKSFYVEAPVQFQPFRLAYYDPNLLYCEAAPLRLTFYSGNAYYYGYKSRYELWEENQLIDVIEDKSGELRFKQIILDKTTTFTIKATLSTSCETYTQQESITFNVAPFADLTLSVEEVEEVVCPDSWEKFSIRIKNSQVGFTYAVKYGYQGAIAYSAEGNGGDLILQTPYYGAMLGSEDILEGNRLEIPVYVWNSDCNDYYAKVLHDKAVMKVSFIKLKVAIANDRLVRNEALRINNLSVADHFKWIVTDGAQKTEYHTAQLPAISFGTSGVKVIELFLDMDGVCSARAKYNILVGDPVASADLSVCTETDISTDEKNTDRYLIGDGVDRIMASHVDKAGFVYTTGSQDGRLFLSKRDSSGKEIWTINHKGGGYQGNSAGSAIVTDDEGNVYVGGYTNTQRFALGSLGFKASSYSLALMFIVKVDKEGNTVWGIMNDARHGGYSPGPYMLTDLAIDQAQNIYGIFKSGVGVRLEFPDGTSYENIYGTGRAMPKFNYSFVAPTYMLKTNKQGENKGITVLHDKGIAHDINYSMPGGHYTSWRHFSTPKIKIGDNNKAYIIGSRLTVPGEPFYVADYLVPTDQALLDKYPDGGVLGYVAVMDLGTGKVEKAFNTYFREEIEKTWISPYQWDFTTPYVITPQGIVVGHSWDMREIADSWQPYETAGDVVLGGVTHKNIKNGSLTAAYDWNGNQLWATVSHDAFINDYHYDIAAEKLYAYARINHQAMVGLGETENYGKVSVKNGINTGFLVYSKEGKLLSVEQTAGQENSEIPYSMAVGQCGEVYLMSGILHGNVHNNIEFMYVLNNTHQLRILSLNGACGNSTSVTVPAIQKVICKGESVRLELGGAGIKGISWYPTLGLDDPTSSSPLATPATTTSYYATIQTTDGCTIARVVRVQVDEPLTIPDKFSVVSSTLYPREYKFFSPKVERGNNYSYEWDFDGVKQTTQDAFFNFPENGEYTVSLRIWNQCSEKVITQVVKVPCNTATIPTAGIGHMTTGKSVTFSLLDPQHVESVLWEFGDGSKSTDFNPTHTFAAVQSYYVKLTIRSACYENIYYKTINLNCPTLAGNIQAVVDRQQALFSVPDVPTNYIVKWVFGDGKESTQKAPSHTFAATGRYTVTLHLAHPCGTETRTTTVDIICGNPVATFSTAITKDMVTFTPALINTLLTYTWDFGDGRTSSEMTPTHTYATGGDFQVRLTITDACGAVSSTRTIEVCKVQASAEFTYTIEESNSLLVSFRPLVLQESVSYLWMFGDGTTSKEPKPQHQYHSTGQFQVTLVASAECHIDTVQQYVNFPTGLVEDEESRLMKTYPNPVRDMLYLELPFAMLSKVSGLAVHDALGRSVLELNSMGWAEKNTIDVSKLSRGHYFLKIKRRDGSFAIRKFVVDR
jgi:PKD repeat protein/photosystem II stability/assembly factor-like uncharacterized protein